MAKNTNVVTNKSMNQNYWVDRSEKVYLAGEKKALKTARHLKSLYKETSNIITDKINAFYGKYAFDNEMTLDEARKFLNRNELKDFKSYIKKMISMGNKNNFSPEEMTEFKQLYTKARITRLEELQANIRSELDKLSVSSISELDTLLSDTYSDAYYNTIYNVQMAIGTSNSFSGLNTKAIEKAVNTKYLGSTFSSNIWKSTNQLMGILTREIPKGLVLGYNPRKLARDVVSKRIDKTLYNNTVRLIRTEYSHILNQATLDGYGECGIDKFKILTALDSRRCDDCGAFEGKVVDIKKAMEGVDIPPFHPNCRCTTIPYFKEDEIDSMSDEELETIGFVTYDDWKDGLVELKDGQVQYNWNDGLKKE